MIFLLDDDELILEALRGALSTLAPVQSGTLWSQLSSPLFSAARAKKDVILICDLKMPGIDGLEFCKIVRRYVPSSKIVVFSSSVESLEARKSEGTVDVAVSKQDGLDPLVREVKRLIRAFERPS